ncbi:MAG: M23 family metallopeptidase [Polyangiales bacterium]
MPRQAPGSHPRIVRATPPPLALRHDSREWTMVVTRLDGHAYTLTLPHRGRLWAWSAPVLALLLGALHAVQDPVPLGTARWSHTPALAYAAASLGTFLGFNPQTLVRVIAPPTHTLPSRMAPVLDAGGRLGHLRYTARQKRISHRADALGLGSAKAAQQLLSGTLTPAWHEALRAHFGTQEPETLRWPVDDGYYGRGYGSGSGGYHLAVDIQAPAGHAVRAAASGLVGYAGTGIRGYGNLVLLMHPGGWVTAYAHNRKNLVQPGRFVERGERIALLGNSGKSRGPHLHFELLWAFKKCDPLPLFRPGVRLRPGRQVPLSRTHWQASTPKPQTVRCHAPIAHPSRLAGAATSTPAHAHEHDDAHASLLAGL